MQFKYISHLTMIEWEWITVRESISYLLFAINMLRYAKKKKRA